MTNRRENELILHEEELEVSAVVREHGTVRIEKRIEIEDVSEEVPRRVELVQVDRVAAGETDSGEVETLADGSISIPILEEELVITKRVVVRERIVIRKETTIEHEQVSAELRKEHVDIDHTDT